MQFGTSSPLGVPPQSSQRSEMEELQGNLSQPHSRAGVLKPYGEGDEEIRRWSANMPPAENRPRRRSSSPTVLCTRCQDFIEYKHAIPAHALTYMSKRNSGGMLGDRTAPGASKRPRKRSKRAPARSKWVPKRPKKAPRRRPQERPNRAPREPQEGPQTAQQGEEPQESPTRPVTARAVRMSRLAVGDCSFRCVAVQAT